MAAWGYEFLSSRAESISHSFASLTRERYIPARPCNILYFSGGPRGGARRAWAPLIFRSN